MFFHGFCKESWFTKKFKADVALQEVVKKTCPKNMSENSQKYKHVRFPCFVKMYSLDLFQMLMNVGCVRCKYLVFHLTAKLTFEQILLFQIENSGISLMLFFFLLDTRSFSKFTLIPLRIYRFCDTYDQKNYSNGSRCIALRAGSSSND